MTLIGRLQRNSRAFTLVELLVVIAIIAILADILFPVFLNVREHARQQKCVTNLRQLALAVRAYADDCNGRAPNPRICISNPSWEGSVHVSHMFDVRNGQLFPYVRNTAIYICPTDIRRPAQAVVKHNDGNPEIVDWAKTSYPLSYSMNCDFINADTAQTICLDVVRRTKDVLLLIHESRKTINDGDFNWRALDQDAPSDVHYDGTTLVYLDQHAVWHSAKLLTQQKDSALWDPLR